jgi:dTMP kinase
MFVVFEGIDGSGTTTQLRRVAAALRTRGHAVHETREPSNGPVGRLVRDALRSEERLDHRVLALLFAADRIDHFAREIQPALRRGEVVLSDRYLGSSLIYQGAFCDLAWVREINRHAHPADLTLVLDVGAEEAHRRRAARGEPAELFEDAALQARLAEAYRSLPALLPAHGVQVVDGGGPPEAVESRLVEAIVGHL